MKERNTWSRLLPFFFSLCFFFLAGDSLFAKIKELSISNEFDITLTEWETMLADLPGSVCEKIKKNNKSFLSHIALILNQPEEFTLLVDRNHPIPNAENYEPADLQPLSIFPQLKMTENPLPHRLIRSALLGYVVMEEAARREGVELIVCSTYRTYDYQKRLNNRYKKEDSTVDFRTYSALPGHSQHHLGTTIDFYPTSKQFAHSKAGKWLKEHAHQYGFSLSFPEGQTEKTGYIYEPWHYRYVGTQVSHLLHYYFEDNQQLFMEWWDSVKATIKQKRR